MSIYIEAPDVDEITEDCELIPWSTKYVLYLWLSMILLSPFDLNTIVSGDPVSRILSVAKLGLANSGLLRLPSYRVVGITYVA